MCNHCYSTVQIPAGLLRVHILLLFEEYHRRKIRCSYNRRDTIRRFLPCRMCYCRMWLWDSYSHQDDKVRKSPYIAPPDRRFSSADGKYPTTAGSRLKGMWMWNRCSSPLCHKYLQIRDRQWKTEEKHLRDRRQSHRDNFPEHRSCRPQHGRRWRPA